MNETAEELDVERYEKVATLDSLTSDICRFVDGKVFIMKEYEAGLTAPPSHYNCRTVTRPYFDDEFTEEEKRAARGKDGKTYYVPADMSYSSWYKEFVKNPAKSDKIKLSEDEQYALNQYLSFESYSINEKLRKRLELTTKEKKMVENLDRALEKMLYYEENLSRSLYFGNEAAVKVFLRKFNAGKIFLLESL